MQIRVGGNSILEDIPVSLADNDIMEELSYSYVQIIACMSGKTTQKQEKDFGIDVQIRDLQNIKGKMCPSDTILDVQLKSTTNYEDDGEFIKYALKNKNLNDLSIPTRGTHRILVLFCMPKKKTEWIEQNYDVLQLRNCAFWHSLKGHPILENSDSKTVIQLRKIHLFSVENLNLIFDTIKMDGDLNGI